MRDKIKLCMSRYTAQDIISEIAYVLDLLNKEHEDAGTHSQRNAYQAVIRNRLELLESRVRSSDEPRLNSNSGVSAVNEADSIPF